MTQEPSIAWRAIVYGTPVYAADGSRVGTVREVLGSDADDIFHGIRVNVDGRTKDDVVVTPEDIGVCTTSAIRLDLAPEKVRAMPAYDEEATYHLASVGWLRKHLGWRRDSSGDEEPG